MTIQWAGVDFLNLAPFPGWEFEGGPGIFAVAMQPDARNKPGDYRMLFVGESEDVSSAEFFRSHPRFVCCVSEAGKVDALYFAVVPMPNSDQAGRKRVVQLLAQELHPVCNW